MPIDETKLKRIETILKIANEGLSVSEFTKAFKSLVAFVQKVKDGLEIKFNTLEIKIMDKVNQLKDGVDGRDGKDGIGIKGDKGEEGKEGKSIQGVTGADGSPDVPKVILEKIRSLEDGLNIDDIDGLQELLDELEEKRLGSRVSGGGLNVGSWAIRTVDNEIIGTGDGSTTDFDVNIAPSPATSLHILVGTVELFLTDDWTLSGRTVSFITAPPLNSKIRANYRIG